MALEAAHRREGEEGEEARGEDAVFVVVPGGGDLFEGGEGRRGVKGFLAPDGSLEHPVEVAGWVVEFELELGEVWQEGEEEGRPGVDLAALEGLLPGLLLVGGVRGCAHGGEQRCCVVFGVWSVRLWAIAVADAH